MPTGWLRAFAAMLPRLRDEETLRDLTGRMAAEGRVLTDEARAEFLRSLTRVAPQRARRPVTLDDLRAVVNVVEVPVG